MSIHPRATGATDVDAVGVPPPLLCVTLLLPLAAAPLGTAIDEFSSLFKEDASAAARRALLRSILKIMRSSKSCLH